jgi:hypothetical protein
MFHLHSSSQALAIGMKGINTPGQTKEEALPPFPPQGALYLTLLSPPSLGNGTMVMLPLLSLRWGMGCLFDTLFVRKMIQKGGAYEEHPSTA